MLEISVHLEEVLNDKIKSSHTLSGGCINHCYRLCGQKQDYFVKVNFDVADDFFTAETRGLKSLSTYIKTPSIYTLGKSGTSSYLVLEWCEPLRPTQELWQEAGRQLANLHKDSKQDAFGLSYNNYIGSLKQSNFYSDDAKTFWLEQRLVPLTEQAIKRGLLENHYLESIKALATIPLLNPDTHSSLLHGDLWSGNLFFTQNSPVFIDPSIYYGNREIDLAMTELFGGFPSSFYDSYNTTYPLHKDYDIRKTWWQLYPLLVHLNLFGDSYRSQVDSALNQLECI